MSPEAAEPMAIPTTSANIDNVANSVVAPVQRHQQSHARRDAGNNHRSGTSRRRLQEQFPATDVNASQICRFFGTPKGCRAGDRCPFQHVQKQTQTQPTDGVDSPSKLTHNPSQHPTRSIGRNTTSRPPVRKPISSLEQANPREFQIGQIIRRFAPFRADVDNVTTLKIKFQPSDPDFPFELGEGLQCILIVPSAFPGEGRPSLKVGNAEMARGFQINVERGFEDLAARYPSRKLLDLMNELDKNLETLLTAEKAQTIKIVTNTKKTEKSITSQVEKTSPRQFVTSNVHPKYGSQELDAAKTKRESDIRQLEARMGRVPLFSKSSDGVTFNVPIQIARPSTLPVSLQSLKEVVLIVPPIYPFEPCTIMLKGVGTDADRIESLFEQHAKANPTMTLMARINYLTQNLHSWAADSASRNYENLVPVVDEAVADQQQERKLSKNTNPDIIDSDKPHLKFIARPPPEWNETSAGVDGSGTDSSEYDTEDEMTDSDDADNSDLGGASLPLISSSLGPEKGIMVSFPHLDLTGIELLQISDLSLTVRCDRCKSSLDVKDIKASSNSQTNIRRTETCFKCSTPLSIQFRPEAMHINSNKAGYLDLEGCSTIIDMLPSAFLPTCSECSTTATSIVSVRGETSLSICRTCHNKLTFKIPEVKFLRTSSVIGSGPSLPLRRKKENLGISAGTELPARGNCKHYTKSYRWFRFSCCNKVFPCDKCHDDQTDHPNEHAERMICGWCSREQRYRPDTCGLCGKNVVRKINTIGFWEGGKGTREKGLMRRKEKRKFKRSAPK